MLSNSTATSRLARPAAIASIGTGALIHGFADPGTTLGIILLVVDLVLTLLAVIIIARGANAAAPALVVAYLALAIFMVALIIAWNRKQSSLWIPSGPGAPTTDPTSSTINVVLTVTSYTAKLAALALLLLPEHFSAKALESALVDRRPAYEDWPKSQSMPAAGTRKGSEVTMDEAFVQIRNALRDFTGDRTIIFSKEQQRLAEKLFPEKCGVQQDPSDMFTKLTLDKHISQRFSELAFEMRTTTKCTVSPENPSTETTNEYFLPLKSNKQTATMTELFGDFLQEQTIDDDDNRLERCGNNAFTTKVDIDPKGNFLLVYTIRSNEKGELQPRVISNPWSDVKINGIVWYPIAWIHHSGPFKTYGHYTAYIVKPKVTQYIADQQGTITIPPRRYYKMNDLTVTKFDTEPKIEQDDSNRLAYVLLCNDQQVYKDLWERRAGTEGNAPSGIPNIGNTCFANSLLQLLRLTPAFD